MLKIKLKAIILLLVISIFEFYFIFTNNAIWMLIGLLAMIILSIVTEIKKALYKRNIILEEERIMKENNENLKIIAEELKKQNK